jgi:4-amino-4-deoxy-L-arabinose transferase-like glycosyltransferase
LQRRKKYSTNPHEADAFLKTMELKFRRLAAFALFGVVAAYYVVGLHDSPWLGSDSATYVGLAQGLAAGHGYREIWLADSPPHTKFPPLLPAMLAGVVAVLGTNLPAMEMLVVLFGLAAITVCFLLFRRIDRNLAPWVTLCTACCWFFYGSAHTIMAETPFMFFSLATLYCLVRALDKQDKGRNAAAIGGIILFWCSYATRSHGICLAVAAAAALISDREAPLPIRIRRTSIAVAVMCAPIMLWALRNHVAGAGSPGGYAGYLFTDPYNPGGGALGFHGVLKGIMQNGYAYVVYAVPEVITGIHHATRSATAIGVSALVVAGFFLALRRTHRVIFWFVVAYFGVLVLWPWSKVGGQRFIVPIAPLLMYYLLFAVRAMTAWFTKDNRRSAAVAALGACLLIALNVHAAVARGGIGRLSVESKTDQNEEFKRVAGWINGAVEPESAVLTYFPATLYQYSNRKTVDMVYRPDKQSYLKFVDSSAARYVLVDTLSIGMVQAYYPAFPAMLRDFPGIFDLKYDKSGNRVYRIDRPALRRVSAGNE